MRVFISTSGCCALCVFIALFAQSETIWAADFAVSLMLADGDRYQEQDKEQVKREISLEWAQLQTRLTELDKDVKRQTDQMTLPQSMLVGSLLSEAMQRVLVLRPKQARRLIGLVPQPPMNGKGRSIALHNISRWEETGRKLDMPSSNDLLVALLYEEEMKEASGGQFVVDGVRYSATVRNDRLVFRRLSAPQ
jgi:hypothetical protein